MFCCCWNSVTLNFMALDSLLALAAVSVVFLSLLIPSYEEFKRDYSRCTFYTDCVGPRISYLLCTVGIQDLLGLQNTHLAVMTEVSFIIIPCDKGMLLMEI